MVCFSYYDKTLPYTNPFTTGIKVQSSGRSAKKIVMVQLNKKEKFIQMDKEAAATLVASLIITVFFWLSIILFKDQSLTVFYMPLWFVVSCIGGYLLSIVAVIILVRYFMKNFSLNSEHDKKTT